jgi:thiamine kinase-like enzyme
MRSDRGLRHFIQEFGVQQQFWLTTLQGEMRTAAPLSDGKTIGYFLRHNLYASSVNVERWLKWLRRSVNGRRPKAPSRLPVTQSSTQKAKRRANSAASRLGSTAKRVGSILLRLWEPAEDVIDRLYLRSRLFRRHGVVAGAASPLLTQQPPQYLCSIAKAANISLDHYRWGLVAQGNYSSRKLLFFLFDPAHKSAHSAPQYIVKMVRNPALNARLENECRALVWLQNHGFAARALMPQVAFSGHHAKLTIVGETVIDGAPFRQKSQATVDCPFAHAAIDWLTDLGVATANSTVARPGQVVESLHRLLAQFTEIYRPTETHYTFLADQIAMIGNSEPALPLVFQHGDPGPWNILVTGSNQVAFLDWEASEIQGMPLWDLFYFLRSYCVGAARKRGIRNQLAGFRHLVLTETPFSHLVIDATRRYCERTGVSKTLVEPLFYTCWMHRALKEAMRLPPARVEDGHFFRLLRLCIVQRNSAVLTRLFANYGE